MKILLAESAGFCFGVKNAVDKAEKSYKSDENVFTYGPIIHNNTVVEDLKKKGIGVINNIEETRAGDKIIIRSHGISKNEHEKLKEAGVDIIDATCPYVKHIHKIVEEKDSEGYKIIIIGDPDHPEVKGIDGWCGNCAAIINSEEDLESIKEGMGKICVVSQTTYNEDRWYSIINKIVKLSKEILIYNTICNATELRQREARELSKKADVMIVIGGKESSNTKKLYEICSGICSSTQLIETADELDMDKIGKEVCVGVTAGASTPEYIISEVINKLSSYGDAEVSRKESIKCEEMDSNAAAPSEKNEVKTEMQDFYRDFEDIYIGRVLKGTVIMSTAKEVFFDIGYKSDGILPKEEAANLDVDLKVKYKPGDEVEVEVLKTNDGEGNVLLSRRSLEKQEFYDLLREYKDSGKTIEVLVTGVNKGGLDCKYGDIKVFIPMSLSGLGREETPDALTGKKIEVKISEIREKKQGVEIVASRKEILREQREKRVREMIEMLEDGQVLEGSVKSMIDAGAFVKIGDIDAFVPISEISWKRISKPQDILKEGDNVRILLIKINREALKVTASIKRIQKDPWENFIENHNEGDIMEGKVVSLVTFGAFVEVADGISGLVHISNMSEGRINRPQEVVKLGQTVNVKVTKIDRETKKVALSIKDV